MLRRWVRAGYRRAVKPTYVRYCLATARTVLHLTFRSEGIGFFAQLSAVLHFLRHAEVRGFVPAVALTSLNYADSGMGDDWFQYYFAPCAPDVPRGARGTRHLKIGNIDELPDIAGDLSLAEAHDLFFRHVQIKPEVTAIVDGFVRRHGVGAGTVGVHYRGTDKPEEATPVAYEAVFTVIERVLAGQAGPGGPGADSLFVASDEQAFITGVAARFPGLRVCMFEDSKRSEDGRPVHMGQRAAGNHLLGRDALVNCLLLSRCGAVVRSTSFLSAWASIFNPALPVVLLNTPFANKLWFPEREIMKTAVLARDLVR